MQINLLLNVKSCMSALLTRGGERLVNNDIVVSFYAHIFFSKIISYIFL